MSEIRVRSKKITELIDITYAVDDSIKNLGIYAGIIAGFTKHTTFRKQSDTSG